MKILGVDYGRRKVGLAVADGHLAEPLKVIRVNSLDEAAEKVAEAVEAEKVEKVIVGMSEGKMAEETRNFLSTLVSRLSTVPVETFDETLTTQDAQKLAIEAGIKRLKRKALEDAFAAAVMLQSYLDIHV